MCLRVHVIFSSELRSTGSIFSPEKNEKCNLMDACINSASGDSRSIHLMIFTGLRKLIHYSTVIYFRIDVLCLKKTELAFEEFRSPGFRFYSEEHWQLVCSGSVVVTAYDSESGRPGSNPEWGLIYYEASITAQGLPEPSSLWGSTLGTRATKMTDKNNHIVMHQAYISSQKLSSILFFSKMATTIAGEGMRHIIEYI